MEVTSTGSARVPFASPPYGYSSHEVLPCGDIHEETPLDHLFHEERSMLRMRLENEPFLSPFRFLSDALLNFLSGEKLRLSMSAETRLALDENGREVSGYLHEYHCCDDAFHPKEFHVFDLKGFWIPESEGEFFSIDGHDASCPLTRTRGGEREILFLIHPKSEELFFPLMEKYAHTQVAIPALSLSSFRSLLIAIPTPIGPHYTMVKVSLYDTIGGVLRVLYRRECGGSVANTSILQQKPSSISFMKEDFSFVVHSHLINPRYSTIQAKGAGMIHRCIPDCLLNPLSKEYVIPFFALFGSKNRALLDLLIRQSQKTPTQFVVEFLLKPLADAFIDLLYFQNCSIEAHGQNLLLVINTADPSGLKIQFMYRDMGGVNSLISEREMERTLPCTMQDKGFFYFDNHYKDAADVLEGIARKVLFNLTKQFFKSEMYETIDPEFEHWKQAMLSNGFGANWHILGKDPLGEDPDAHCSKLSVSHFYRYGYFEKIFGNLFLESLSLKGIFIVIRDYHPELNYRFFADSLCNPKNPYNTCLEIEWFKELILKTYPLYSKAMGRDSKDS